MRSLRLRLIALFMVIEIGVILSMAALVHHRSTRAMIDALDAELAAVMREFASELEEGEPPEEIAGEHSEHRRTESEERPSQLYQVRHGDGRTAVLSPPLRGESLPLPEDWEGDLDVGDVGFSFAEWDGGEVRLATMVVSSSLRLGTEITDANRDQAYVVQVSLETDDFRDTQRDLIEYLVIIGGSLLVISLVGGYLLATWSLRPVRRLGNEVRRITECNLDRRLPESTLPGELLPLSEGFNETLARLESAFEREKQFLADASHELRTPVSVSMAALEVALRQRREPEEYVEAMEKSLRATARMRRLVERMMTLARDEGRRSSLRMTAVDLVSVVDEVAEFLRPLAERHQIEIAWQRPRETLLVQGDQARLEELAEILISNGIVHSRPGGEVNVELSPGDGGKGCALRVVDTGLGIAPEHLPHIFERFYRVDKARSREHGGSGLGLAIAKGIAEAHGGEIEVDSRPGKGSAFCVRIPN